ncbi:MAG: formylglycine-generating enzyme family protein [Desulfovibrionaceae bacterium]
MTRLMRYIALGLALVAGMWWADTARAGQADQNPGVIEWTPQGIGERIDYLNMRDYPDDPTVALVRGIGLPGFPYTDPTTGMEFVWVPGGCFQMGSDYGGHDEKPVHEVCVDGFWMGKYEVTQAEWRQVMGNKPSNFKGDRNPVENVSWDDVQGFIRRLNGRGNGGFRLPTEAEWEYAARSGGRTETYAGGENVDRVAWYNGNSGGKAHPVGGKAPNGLGLYDMSGNMWEWCQDWYGEGYYAASPRSNPTGPGGYSARVVRGGSWLDGPRHVRSALRRWHLPSITLFDLGFRLLRTN